MHTNVHCSTVYNSKDLEPTQMPINDRLNRENVAHIHYGILCSHQKWWVCVLCRDMDESGNHRSQQTDTRRENQTPLVLTHRQVLNKENTWTQGGGITHWGLWQGTRRSTGGVGSWGGITWGEMPDIGHGEEGRKPHCQVCTYATILHVHHTYPKT